MSLIKIDFYNEDEAHVNEAMSELYDSVLTLPAPGHYKILVVEVEPVRHLKQNNYYWLILTVIEQYTGHEKWELHRIFALMFNMRIEETTKNELLVFPGTTSAIKEKAFHEYCKKIRFFALNFMGVSEEMWDKAIPPKHQVTEEMLLKAGIY